MFEKYIDGKTADDLVTSWSVAKSIVSLLMGTALDDAYLQSIDNQSVSEFVESWQDSEKAEITLRNMMTVRTALEVVNATSFYTSDDQLPLALNRELIGEPGDRLYNYSNADIMVAGEVLRVATGMSADEYMNARVNGTLGIQSTEWWIDAQQHVLAYCCIDGTARDFARFGLLYARNGDWNRTGVVSTEWIDTSTEYAKTGTGNQSATANVDAGYGFYWWPIGNGGIGAFGLHSQIIAIYPDIDMVVLRFSNYIRLGSGEPIRMGANLHRTLEPTNFDNAVFLSHVYDAVQEATE